MATESMVTNPFESVEIVGSDVIELKSSSETVPKSTYEISSTSGASVLSFSGEGGRNFFKVWDNLKVMQAVVRTSKDKKKLKLSMLYLARTVNADRSGTESWNVVKQRIALNSFKWLQKVSSASRRKWTDSRSVLPDCPQQYDHEDGLGSVCFSSPGSHFSSSPLMPASKMLSPMDASSSTINDPHVEATLLCSSGSSTGTAMRSDEIGALPQSDEKDDKKKKKPQNYTSEMLPRIGLYRKCPKEEILQRMKRVVKSQQDSNGTSGIFAGTALGETAGTVATQPLTKDAFVFDWLSPQCQTQQNSMVFVAASSNENTEIETDENACERDACEEHSECEAIMKAWEHQIAISRKSLPRSNSEETLSTKTASTRSKLNKVIGETFKKLDKLSKASKTDTELYLADLVFNDSISLAQALKQGSHISIGDCLYELIFDPPMLAKIELQQNPRPHAVHCPIVPTVRIEDNSPAGIRSFEFFWVVLRAECFEWKRKRPRRSSHQGRGLNTSGTSQSPRKGSRSPRNSTRMGPLMRTPSEDDHFTAADEEALMFPTNIHARDRGFASKVSSTLQGVTQLYSSFIKIEEEKKDESPKRSLREEVSYPFSIHASQNLLATPTADFMRSCTGGSGGSSPSDSGYCHISLPHLSGHFRYVFQNFPKSDLEGNPVKDANPCGNDSQGATEKGENVNASGPPENMFKGKNMLNGPTFPMPITDPETQKTTNEGRIPTRLRYDVYPARIDKCIGHLDYFVPRHAGSLVWLVGFHPSCHQMVCNPIPLEIENPHASEVSFRDLRVAVFNRKREEIEEDLDGSSRQENDSLHQDAYGAKHTQSYGSDYHSAKSHGSECTSKQDISKKRLPDCRDGTLGTTQMSSTTGLGRTLTIEEATISASASAKSVSSMPGKSISVVMKEPKSPSPTDRLVRVVSFNVLASCYLRGTQNNMYPYCAPHFMTDAYRFPRLGRELIELNADILCLQECSGSMDRYFRSLLAAQYLIGFKPKSSKANNLENQEGCLMAFKRSKFEILDRRDVEISEDLLRIAEPSTPQVDTTSQVVEKVESKNPSRQLSRRSSNASGETQMQLRSNTQGSGNKQSSSSQPQSLSEKNTNSVNNTNPNSVSNTPLSNSNQNQMPNNFQNPLATTISNAASNTFASSVSSGYHASPHPPETVPLHGPHGPVYAQSGVPFHAIQHPGVPGGVVFMQGPHGQPVGVAGGVLPPGAHVMVQPDGRHVVVQHGQYFLAHGQHGAHHPQYWNPNHEWYYDLQTGTWVQRPPFMFYPPGVAQNASQNNQQGNNHGGQSSNQGGNSQNAQGNQGNQGNNNNQGNQANSNQGNNRTNRGQHSFSPNKRKSRRTPEKGPREMGNASFAERSGLKPLCPASRGAGSECATPDAQYALNNADSNGNFHYNGNSGFNPNFPNSGSARPGSSSYNVYNPKGFSGNNINGFNTSGNNGTAFGNNGNNALNNDFSRLDEDLEVFKDFDCHVVGGRNQITGELDVFEADNLLGASIGVLRESLKHTFEEVFSELRTVGQICIIQSRDNTDKQTRHGKPFNKSKSDRDRKQFKKKRQVFIVVNTHLFYHPDAPHVRILQVACLIRHVLRAKREYPEGKVIFCGDLNSQMNTGAMHLLQQGHISYSDWQEEWNQASSFKWGKRFLPLPNAPVIFENHIASGGCIMPQHVLLTALKWSKKLFAEVGKRKTDSNLDCYESGGVICVLRNSEQDEIEVEQREKLRFEESERYAQNQLAIRSSVSTPSNFLSGSFQSNTPRSFPGNNSGGQMNGSEMPNFDQNIGFNIMNLQNTGQINQGNQQWWDGNHNWQGSSSSSSTWHQGQNQGQNNWQGGNQSWNQWDNQPMSTSQGRQPTTSSRKRGRDTHKKGREVPINKKIEEDDLLDRHIRKALEKETAKDSTKETAKDSTKECAKDSTADSAKKDCRKDSAICAQETKATAVGNAVASNTLEQEQSKPQSECQNSQNENFKFDDQKASSCNDKVQASHTKSDPKPSKILGKKRCRVMTDEKLIQYCQYFATSTSSSSMTVEELTDIVITRGTEQGDGSPLKRGDSQRDADGTPTRRSDEGTPGKSNHNGSPSQRTPDSNEAMATVMIRLPKLEESADSDREIIATSTANASSKNQSGCATDGAKNTPKTAGDGKTEDEDVPTPSSGSWFGKLTDWFGKTTNHEPDTSTKAENTRANTDASKVYTPATHDSSITNTSMTIRNDASLFNDTGDVRLDTFFHEDADSNSKFLSIPSECADSATASSSKMSKLSSVSSKVSFGNTRDTNTSKDSSILSKSHSSPPFLNLNDWNDVDSASSDNITEGANLTDVETKNASNDNSVTHSPVGSQPANTGVNNGSALSAVDSKNDASSTVDDGAQGIDKQASNPDKHVQNDSSRDGNVPKVDSLITKNDSETSEKPIESQNCTRNVAATSSFNAGVAANNSRGSGAICSIKSTGSNTMSTSHAISSTATLNSNDTAPNNSVGVFRKPQDRRQHRRKAEEIDPKYLKGWRRVREFHNNHLEHSLRERIHMWHDLNLTHCFPDAGWTNAVKGFVGFLDHILVSEGLEVKNVLPIPDLKGIHDTFGGLPNALYPSDHLAVGVDLYVRTEREVQ